jgi:hypothetical protein
LGASKLKEYPNLKVCLYNDLLSVITQTFMCPESLVSARPRELPRQKFAR